MDNINNFISELNRCEMSSFDDKKTVEFHNYNCINGMQGSEYYSVYMEKKYQLFKRDVGNIVNAQSEGKLPLVFNVLKLQVSETIEQISYFQTPTQDDIEALRHDYKSSPFLSIKNELNRLTFFYEMKCVQENYANLAFKFLCEILPKPQQKLKKFIWKKNL